MGQGWFVRMVGTSVLLLASAVVSAGAAPRAAGEVGSSTFVPHARVADAKGVGWDGRRSPFFERACGAMVTAGMGQTFACHKLPHTVYYARSGAAPKWGQSLVS